MRSFPLHEWIVGLLLLAVGFLVAAERLRPPRAGAIVEDARARAEIAGDRLIQRLSLELSHSDTELGAVERCRMLPNGVRFRRGTDGKLVTYTWDPALRCVQRAEGNRRPQVVAHGISAFAVATNPDGQIVLTVESRRAALDREAKHRRTIRLQPE